MNLREMEQDIRERVDTVLEQDLTNPTSSGFNTASELGFACDTFQAARRLKGHLRKRTDLGLAKVFRMGNILEKPTIDLLRKAGLPIFEDPKSSSYEWPAYQIKGHIDAKMELPNEDHPERMPRLIPVEVKTCSPNTFRAVKAAHEQGQKLQESKYLWLRKWPAQLTIYELLFNEDLGLWVFVDKSSGDLLFWYYPLDLAYAEELIQRATRANANVHDGVIPPATFKDLCSRCDFCDTLCFPDRTFGPGVELVIDSSVEEDMARMAELEPAMEEWEGLRQKLIGSNAKPGMFYGRNILVGDFQVLATERRGVTFDVPKEVKDQYKRETKFFIHKVEKMGAPETNGDA